MNRGALLLFWLAMLSAVLIPCYADDVAELQALSDDAFQILHNVSVQLPDGTWARVARDASTDGQMEGLVLKRYVDEFFLGQTLSRLDRGWLAIFRNEPEGFDVAVRFHRDAAGSIQVDFAFADRMGVTTVITAMHALAAGSDPCDGETTTCTGHSGSNPDNGYPNGLGDCEDGSGDYLNTGDVDDNGHPIYDSLSGGDQVVGCDKGPGSTVVTAPR